ncbi:MAG: hypothetical protein KH050_08575 [Clostridiaceae bacterium]|nr:hypothetical protein [Clostridiaceae bacterium]
MNDVDIEVYLMTNEPAFDIGNKQYSVCCVDGIFFTSDSDGKEFDFPNIAALLDGWIVDGKPFRDIVMTIM